MDRGEQVASIDPPPDEPMYIRDPVLDHEFSHEQGERQCISIQETIAKHREISNKVKAENSRIQAERHIKKMAGCLDSDDSDEEPWKNHMDDKHKCMACNKPFWEWRLGQKECEMCQLHEGWIKGFGTREEKATMRENEAARTAAKLKEGADPSGSSGDEPTAQPKAKPKAKPNAKPVLSTLEPWGPKGHSKGKQYRSKKPERQMPWHATSSASQGW